MDADRFDFLLRRLSETPTRRGIARILVSLAVTGVLSTLLGLTDTDAKKKGKRKNKKRKKKCAPQCTGKSCGDDGCGGSCGECAANQICQGGICCTPESAVATCAGRCGTWTNTCGQSVPCTPCSGGKVCLSNGSCATVCTHNGDCPPPCGCTVGGSSEGIRYCGAGGICTAFPQVCSSTAQCPASQYCERTFCGAGGTQEYRCRPLCTSG